MRIGNYPPAARQAPQGPPVRILMFYDEPGWAWWHRAHHIQRAVSENVRIDIHQIGKPFDHHGYDFLLLFDAQLITHALHVPREKIILGSSCPMLTPEALQILKAEDCAAGLVNSLEVYERYRDEARLYCCQNGVDEDLFRPAAAPPPAWVACWVGNSKSIGNKGLDLIRLACARAGVELLAWDRAALAGPEALLTQEQVRDRVYHRAAFFICASESEGTPNPMLESMACGLPVVSTRVGNAPELIRDGYNGFLVDRSVESLEQGIRRLLACDRAALSRNARDSILAGWTWRAQARKYEAAFLELARERRDRGELNPKTGYRHVVWIDAAPCPGAWDPAAWFDALRTLYPKASFSVCCAAAAQERYAAVPGLVSVTPFDPARLAGDLEYRSILIRSVNLLNPDLAIDAGSRPEALGHLLTLTCGSAEHVTDRAFLEAMAAPLQSQFRPLYTRLLATSPGSPGTEAHAWDLIRGLGGRAAEPALPRPEADAASWRPRPGNPKVLFVCHMFPPHWFAGVEVHTWNLAQALRKKGWDVSVLFPLAMPGKKAAELLPSYYGGVPVHTLMHDGRENALFNVEHRVIDPIFSGFLKEQGFAIVHFHHTLGLSFKLAEIVRANGARACMTLHDLWMACQRVHLYIEDEHRMCDGPESADKCARCWAAKDWDSLNEADRTTLVNAFNVRKMKSTEWMVSLDHIVSPTRYVADRLARFGFVPPGRIEVSPLGLNPVARAPGRRPRGGPLRLGYLGTIHKLKNVFLLSDCFKQVRGDATLVFHGMGMGPHVRQLESAIKGDPRISYAGKYGPGDLAGILAGLDMIVVCSITENYPLVVREALSAGVPVLASRVGGIPEIIEDGKTGLLFDPSDPRELVGKLQALVDDPGRIGTLRASIGPVKTMEAEAEEWIARYRSMSPGAPGASPRIPAGRASREHSGH